MHSPEEIQDSRAQSFIGPGEDALVKALSHTEGIKAFHQVQIETDYTADIVCLSLKTGKLCVVEVDGRQHWEGSKQIERDNRRMARLSAKGVPTIRFINKLAERYSYDYVRYIQELLS